MNFLKIYVLITVAILIGVLIGANVKSYLGDYYIGFIMTCSVAVALWEIFRSKNK